MVTFIQADKNRGNNLYGVKEKKSKRISDEPVSGEDDVRKDSNKVENEGKPGKRTSRRITSKSNLGQVSSSFAQLGTISFNTRISTPIQVLGDPHPILIVLLLFEINKNILFLGESSL